MKRQLTSKNRINGCRAIAVAAACTVASVHGQSASAQMNASTRVEVNGRALSTAVPPMQVNGRTLVPMRDIFEALGATVQWNPVTRGIIATRNGTNVGLQIGNRAASINNQRLTLDQSPIVMRGSTLVPLRFVSEALGAQVNWNSAQRLVSVFESGSQVASARSISVPQGAVVPVTMDETVSSANARVGQTFNATVVSENLGDSEFPPGTKIRGVVTQVSPRTEENPGILELDFRSVVLPTGERYPVNAALTSLDSDSVTTTRGRVMAKTSSSDNGDRTKAVAIGGAAGFLIGKLIKRNSIVTAVLGAAGGYLYDRQKNKDRTADAVINRGERIGVRLDRTVSYADASDYYPARSGFVQTSD
ncbi:MAG TPA: stalk domain-containing protein [Abditibacteriaceae bacterium]|jgi:hypothetical protein